MNTGQIISGTGHLALIGWALFGGSFQSAPPPFEVVQATTVSESEFAAIMDRAETPDAVANVDTPDPPEEGETAPQETPEAEQPAESDPAPAPEDPAPPEQPEAEEMAPDQPAPPEDTALMVPEVAPRPQQRPAPRVAPESAPEPEPDTRVDDETQPEVTPDEGADTAEEPSEATAPEEAAREIVTEAEESDEAQQAAPPAAVRPRQRPDRPDPPSEVAQAPSDPEPEQDPEPQSEPEPEPRQQSSDRAAIDDALAAALGEAQQDTERPSGPPLTGGERDALRVAVQRCWNVGSLSTEALRTTVVVAVSMTENGRPEIGSIRLVGSSGGGDAAAKQAFDAARRAIIRCGNDGFDLPSEKYDQWRDIEMTFNPESMRIR